MSTLTADRVRQCTIYAARGQVQISSLAALPELPPRLRARPDAVPLREVMSRELICARPELELAAVIALIARHRIGCLPIVDVHRRPIGMITKQDVVEQLDDNVRSRAPGAPIGERAAPETAADVMLPLALMLEEHATVAHAASMMESEDTHHVLVVDTTGALVGVVSSKDLVTWLVINERLFGGGDDVYPDPDARS